MRHQIIVHYIFVQGSHKPFVVAAFKPYAVIYTSVIYQAIDAAKLFQSQSVCTAFSQAAGSVQFSHHLESLTASSFQ